MFSEAKIIVFSHSAKLLYVNARNTNNFAFLSVKNISKSFTHPKLCYFLRTHNSF